MRKGERRIHRGLIADGAPNRVWRGVAYVQSGANPETKAAANVLAKRDHSRVAQLIAEATK